MGLEIALQVNLECSWIQRLFAKEMSLKLEEEKEEEEEEIEEEEEEKEEKEEREEKGLI